MITGEGKAGSGGVRNVRYILTYVLPQRVRIYRWNKIEYDSLRVVLLSRCRRRCGRAPSHLLGALAAQFLASLHQPRKLGCCCRRRRPACAAMHAQRTYSTLNWWRFTSSSRTFFSPFFSPQLYGISSHTQQEYVTRFVLLLTHEYVYVGNTIVDIVETVLKSEFALLLLQFYIVPIYIRSSNKLFFLLLFPFFFFFRTSLRLYLYSHVVALVFIVFVGSSSFVFSLHFSPFAPRLSAILRLTCCEDDYCKINQRSRVTRGTQQQRAM